MLLCVCILFNFQFSIFNSAWAQKPGTTPVKVSFETQMLHGRRYYVHIVEKGQTVYSIAKAYKVSNFDAVTHVDIHSLHPGDTVWLPFRGQFAENEAPSTPAPAPKPTPTTPQVNTVTVHDTAYIYVHDTAYINVPYAVHDTTVVTNTVTKTEYVRVHDTIYVDAPYAVHDTTVVTNTVTQKEYVTVHDTTYITVHDTTYINVPYAVHDTTVVTDKVTLTEYVPVHDTIYVQVHDTTVVTNTVTQTEYVPVHDTAYITVHDTTIVSDKVTQTEYVTVHDTTYVPVHDTTYVAVRDTTYINVPYAVHDTTIVSDKVTLTEYVPVHDTTIITDTVTLTKYVTVHDTTIVTDTVTLTKYVTVHDTTYIDVPYAVHDTTFVFDTVDFTSSSALAFASTSAVALAEYEPASQPDANPESPMAAQPQRKMGKVLKVAVMMPLHLNQLDQISTSKFDIEQRGKKTYRQFEFIEFYEGILLALDRLAEQGVNVELNVVDVSENSAAKVEEAFISHNVAQSDFVVALLLRDAFDKAAELAQQAGVYIVNPMATRTELCAENPYMVKVQPSVEGMISLMLKNMKVERPNGHLYIIYSNSKAEKAVMDELKRQLDERQDIPYTLFNWSQSAKLAGVLKKTPNCHVLSIFDQDKDNNRVFVGNLLNRLAAFKSDSPTLYTLNDWTRDYIDVDFAQLQLLNYHTFSTSWDMTNDVHINFLQAYRTRFGTEPSSPLAAAGYDLMLYIGNGLSQKNNAFWQSPGNSLPTLIQPMHLSRHGAGLENDKAQLYRLEGLKFIKASFK